MILMKLRAVIDRFEGDKAVLLLSKDGTEAEIPVVWPKQFLPSAHEGDILNISLEVDEAATKKALADNAKLLQEILGSQGG